MLKGIQLPHEAAPSAWISLGAFWQMKTLQAEVLRAVDDELPQMFWKIKDLQALVGVLKIRKSRGRRVNMSGFSGHEVWAKTLSPVASSVSLTKIFYIY